MSSSARKVRVAVFVDGSNLFFLSKKVGFQIDTDKLRHFFERYGTVVDCTYYTGTAMPADAGQERFLTRLSRTGYSVETKPLKTISREDGTEIQKANFDVEMAVDMVLQVDNYDVAVLVSGDTDFERPLRILRSRGKQFKIMSTAGMLASEIEKLAGPHFIEIADHRAVIEKL